jgi:NADPH:quinone reductase
MRAVQLSRHGGPEVLEVVDLPSPQPGAGQVLVEVEAAGVNYMDVYAREAGGNYTRPLPQVLGAEGAGKVVMVGDGVEGLSVGDTVAWKAAPGTMPSRSW